MDERNLKLKNSFIDMMLLVGMDNNSGLFPKELEASVSPVAENIFSVEYQPKVLDCFYSNTVRHFFPSTWEEIFSYSHTLDFRLKQKFSANTTGNNVMPKPIYFTKQSKPTINQISDEDIQNMAAFCFPDGVKLSAVRPADFKINYLVLTNLLGERNYATSLTFHRKYKAEKGDNSWLLKPFEENQLNCDTDNTPSKALTVYVPHSCVFVSMQPYFTVMKQCLSILLNKIKMTSDFHQQMVVFQEFVRQLCVIPLPPTGTLAVGVHLMGHEVILHPAHHSSIPILDLSLHLVFQCFPFDTIIKIITCILTEKQIVFLSSSYALLTIVTESLCSLIYPFSWCHTYVPIVPASCLELLEAPGSFLMGCHLRHLSTVEQISGLVVVNIDKGTVSINQLPSDNAVMSDIFPIDIPMMPEEPVKLLAEVYEKVKFSFDLIDLESPSYFNHKEEVQFRTQKISTFNKRMQYAFVELMVNLFRDIALECEADLKCFKQHNFLEKQFPQNIPFYTEVLKTMLFHLFLENILSQKPSFWSELELKTRTLSRRAGFSQNVFVSSSNKMTVTQQGLVSTSITEELPSEYIFFVPSINNAASCIEYLKECIKLCTEKIQHCRDFSHRTSLIYLRGMYRYACSEYRSAYEDLKTLHESADSIYIPAQLINDASSKIPAYDRPDSLVVEDKNSSKRKSQTINNAQAVTLPDQNIEFQEFMELLYLLDVCHCYEIRKHIFKVLSKQESFVNPMVLSVFLKSWQQNRDQCSQLPQHEKEWTFPEWFLCVSVLIKTSSGLGHLVLTNRRLLFLKHGASNLQSLCRLQQISKIKTGNNHSIFKQVGGLQIFTKDGKKITANLKNHQNMWYLILNEIWSAKMYSIEQKENDAILVGAETVLVLMAFENCKSSLQSHFINIDRVALDMCSFFKLQKSGSLKLSKYTEEVLQIRMNPNLDHDCQAIIDILYIPKGDRSQLWCALGNGVVRVFDASEWELEKEFVQTNQTVACLFSPSSHQVWAGCINIFIINTDHINCLTRLTAHEEPVIAIIQAENTSYAFSASIDGIIHKWDVTSLISVKKMKVAIEEGLKNIKLHDNLIWCVSKKSLLIVDLDGVAIKAVEPSCILKATKTDPMILECFQIVTSSKEIWLGYSNVNRILVLDSETYEIKDNICLKFYGKHQKGVSALIKVKNTLWIATKEGCIHIYNLKSHQKVLVLEAHKDVVHCLHMAADRYVFSGAGSADSKIAVWGTHMLIHPE